MDNTKKKILDGLKKFNLDHLPGRPYDNAFELLAAPQDRKRLIMMGFNGSAADSHMTNAGSISHDHASPFISNIQRGTEGHWGITHLAKRLQQIPTHLGYNWQDVIYTNAIMMCSVNASTLNKEALQFNQNSKLLIKNSMDYFENVTMDLANPELIILHGNSLTSQSAAKLILNNFGDRNTLIYSHQQGYYTTFGYLATFTNRKTPVVCLRHMSRFKPHEGYITSAINLVKAKLKHSL